MKSFVPLLIGVQIVAAFKGLSYSITQDPSGDVLITRTLNWAQGSDHNYGRFCTRKDVDDQIEAGPRSWPYYEECVLDDSSKTSCGTLISQYTVTDMEDEIEAQQNYCYGYKQELLPKPTGPYKITWVYDAPRELGHWIPQYFYEDGGSVLKDVEGQHADRRADYGFIAHVYDVDNNSPEIKIPERWSVMAGCPSQTLDLFPFDLDGDTVECEWANEEEAQGAFHSKHYNSLTLDTKNCVLTYDGTLDDKSEFDHDQHVKLGSKECTRCFKPIAIQVKDYGVDGVLRSSMPVQFAVFVRTPSNQYFPTYRRRRANGDNPDADVLPRRKRRDEETWHNNELQYVKNGPFCNAQPTIIAPSPEAGAVLDATNGIVITLAANPARDTPEKYLHELYGAPNVTSWEYQSPLGMSCTRDKITGKSGGIEEDGTAVCSWFPNADQVGKIFTFCFKAQQGHKTTYIDSQRRCVRLSAVPAGTYFKIFMKKL